MRTLMTKEGYKKLSEELRYYISVERPNIVKAIQTARELGDLSENADYQYAKERQAFIETRIQYLESKLATAEVIDPILVKQDTIAFSATVVLENLDTDEKITYQIVGEDETNPKEGKISYLSPLAKALIGKKKDDEVEVRTPRGIANYKVIDVCYK